MLSTRLVSFYNQQIFQKFPYRFASKTLGATRSTSNLFGGRSPKSASEWTPEDLTLYNITVNEVDPLEFFGLSELPQLSKKVLSSVDLGNKPQKGCNEFTRLLNLANVPDADEKAVDNFAEETLRIMGFGGTKRKIVKQMDLVLLICGGGRHAKLDICVLTRHQIQGRISILYLGGEDKALKNKQGALKHKAQIIAGGVAMFNQNNLYRDVYSLPPLTEAVIPAIIMTGTSPTFLKIPVTQSLSHHIRRGSYPPKETQVIYCHPPVPVQHRKTGMKCRVDRLAILRCYEAFKGVVGI